MKFVCEYCGYSTNRKQVYIKHTERKFKCTEKREKCEYKCILCKKTFSHKGNYNKHRSNRSCIKDVNMEDLLDYIDDKINDMEASTGNNTIINDSHTDNSTDNSTNIQNIQNIYIAPPNKFGKEDMDYLTHEFLNRVITAGVMNGYPSMINQVYFNKNHPENFTYYYPNKRSSEIHVSNGKWYAVKKSDEIFTEISLNCTNHIEEHLNRISDKDILSNEVISKMNRDIDEIVYNENNTEIGRRKQALLIDKIRMNAYDNSVIIKSIYDDTKKQRRIGK